MAISLLLILNEIVLCLRALFMTTPMCSTGTDLGSNPGWNCSAFRYIKKIKPIEVENDLFKFDFSNFFIHLSYPSHKSQTFLPKAASELVGIIKGRGCKKGPEKRTLLILSASKMHWVS